MCYEFSGSYGTARLGDAGALGFLEGFRAPGLGNLRLSGECEAGLMAVYAPGHCLLVDSRKAQRPEGCWQVALMKTKDTLTLNP